MIVHYPGVAPCPQYAGGTHSLMCLGRKTQYGGVAQRQSIGLLNRRSRYRNSPSPPYPNRGCKFDYLGKLELTEVLEYRFS